VADVVADTAAVLDAIGARRCLVGGWSGGGPHALACAARLGQTAAALVIAGVAPYEAPGLDWLADMGEDNLIEFGAATNGEERLLDYLLEVLEHLKEVTAASIIASFASLLPDTDKAVLTDEFGEDIAAAFQEGLGPGVDGWLDDDLAFINPWGFDVGEIAVPTSVWHGSADLFVPFTHGQWIAKHVAGATAHLEPGEGHLSLLLGALDRMLDELVSADVGD
jgi:pimeloyl-ACP methyl ester carboxylesterase